MEDGFPNYKPGELEQYKTIITYYLATVEYFITLPLFNAIEYAVSDQTLAEVIEDARSTRAEVIRSIDNPYDPERGLAILYGNPAPEGALVKQAAVRPEMMDHAGLARVFDIEETAEENDIIEFNVPRKTLLLRLPQEEIQRRLARWSPPPLKRKVKSYLRRYSAQVTSAST
jgi:dihydroxyacid dehydratase/phosphogluconate dehydratase